MPVSESKTIEYQTLKNFNIIKENIYSIEQKLDYTFKEVVLILENFNPTFLNLSGYETLNGSQILENIIYILNSLKSYVEKIVKQNNTSYFQFKFFLDKSQ